SNQYLGGADDSWGIESNPKQPGRTYADQSNAPMGMRVHTVNSPQSAARDIDHPSVDPRKIQWVALGILAIAVIVLGVQTLDNTSDQSPVIVTSDAMIEATDGNVASSDDELENPLVVEADASTVPVKPTVKVNFVPVEVKVVRAKDGQVICENARVCELEIDTDYRATAPNYELLTISGDDLYDRRRVGRWRRVLQPKRK
ncbi:MAG: hypothetical protein VX624_04930, partial [Pseudomonadota bacterium]|nr:hypothetical protein [Pseudomonadota bacterium]